jgi:hypothetical protein
MRRDGRVSRGDGKRAGRTHTTQRTFYCLGKIDEQAMQRQEFELALRRSVAERVQRGFIKTYKPVMDDAPSRVFESLQAYRRWCEHTLPRWLGYGKAK